MTATSEFKAGSFKAKLKAPNDGAMVTRIEKFQSALVKASKFRRRAVVGGIAREFPSGREWSTREYVRAYFTLNKNVFHMRDYNSNDAKAADLAFFEPLSDKVCSVPPGYHETPTAEPWDGIE